MIPKQLRCLYLHGFKRGRSYVKAKQTVSLFAASDRAQDIHVPQLSAEPSKAIDEAQFLYEQLIDEVGIEHVLVIGSSLGGYYASYLAERFGGRAVVINPAIRPYDLLEDYLGENETLYNGEKFTVSQNYIDELKAIDMALKQPQHHLLLVQMQDQTLDSSLAVTKYRNGPCFIEHAGNHSYHDFAKRLPSIINFALSPY
jgi:predicted esterase YcpF (UPF0227 family)